MLQITITTEMQIAEPNNNDLINRTDFFTKISFHFIFH